MGLFDVPGWSVSGEPGTESGAGAAGRKHKKRKREDGKDKNLVDVSRNVESVMRRLGAGAGVGGDSSAVERQQKRHKKAKNKEKGGREQVEDRDQKAETSTSPPSSPHKQKKAKKGLESVPKPTSEPSRSKKSANVTPLQSKMKKSLEGAKFRVINETLYKSDSAEAHRMMQEDPAVFDEYHLGFRSQSSSWPTNPVDHYITTLSRSPKGTVIADLGCGDASLARALLPKGLVVLSYDLVSRNPDGLVVEADICARIPLPGGEEGPAEEAEGNGTTGQVVDACVCSLSLMNTNWVGCVRECWRILKDGGSLKVAEVTSRLKDVKEFIDLIKAVGFKMISKDASNTHFMLFEFRKAQRAPLSHVAWQNLIERGNVLQPCEYKRR